MKEIEKYTTDYKLKLDNFEGPLDLLCHLIEKNKMNIYDISINDITEQYMEYIETMQQNSLEVTGDFLVMASNLLYIKSKILLPSNKEEIEEDPREELINQILEYKQIKEITVQMRKDNEIFSQMYYKEPEKLTFKTEQKLEETYSSDLIPSIFMKIAQMNLDKINHNAKDINRLIERDKVTVRSKIKEILKFLLKKKDMVFNKEFNISTRSKNEVVTAFLAMLELDKTDRIKIEQKYVFGDIMIKSTKNT
ncbi:MAG: chromosome segregation protein ScpA [Clostridiales bacterium]|nr:chromosome segregation protein ScpA [Clostridiales bacterium]